MREHGIHNSLADRYVYVCPGKGVFGFPTKDMRTLLSSGKYQEVEGRSDAKADHAVTARGYPVPCWKPPVEMLLHWDEMPEKWRNARYGGDLIDVGNLGEEIFRDLVAEGHLKDHGIEECRKLPLGERYENPDYEVEPSGERVEVKLDRRCADTGNLYIQTAERRARQYQQ